MFEAIGVMPGGNARHLKSGQPCALAAKHLISPSDDNNIVRRSGWITDGMRSGWRTLRDSVLSSPTSPPTLLECPCQEQRGSDLTTSAPLSNVSTPAYANRVWSILQLVSVVEEHTVDHVILHYEIHRPPYGVHGLTILDDETIERLLNTGPEI